MVSIAVLGHGVVGSGVAEVLRKKIAAGKKYKACPMCGRICPQTDRFCAGCGAEM